MRENSFKRKVKALQELAQCVLLRKHYSLWLLGTPVTFEECDPGTVLVCDRVYALAPKLEIPRLERELPGEVEIVEIPRGNWLAKVKEMIKAKEVGVIKSDLTFDEFVELNRDVKAMKFVDNEVKKIRRAKDEYEISLIRKALEIAERAGRAIEEVEPGMSELEVAGEIEKRMREGGAIKFAFPTIVAFGENAANPHFTPTGRKWNGEPVLADWGAVYNYYVSDITRMSHWERFRDWYCAVLEAQREAIKVMKAGVKAREPYERAYEVLREYGLEKAFIHGLGHGIGVEIHEPPYLTSRADYELIEGDVVTVEPGVYFSGKGGVRLENVVVVKRGGAEELNSWPLSC